MIVVENVSKYYGAHRAVSDLTFKIDQGECVGFLGLNGAGKSTTLRLLSCLSLPTAGRISIQGLDVVSHPHEIRKLVGYLPDVPPLYDEMTVDEYLRFAGSMRGLSGADLTKRAGRAIETCDLGPVRQKPITTLSHGYRQRVGIAQAIIHGPALLILDEPIQGLDPVQIVEMRNMIGELRGEHTILLSSHILTEIEHTCDRILMMHEGRIAASGTEQELAHRMESAKRLRITVRGEQAALDTLLEGLGEASEVTTAPGEDGLCSATLAVGDADREVISRAVIEAGMGLVDMQNVSTGLESVFLQLRADAESTQAAGPAAS